MKLIKKYLFGGQNAQAVSAARAYNLWSEAYDQQPGNLMLDLDEQIFSKLVEAVPIAGKEVLDVGCGTGRHWNKLLAHHPSNLTGFDVSEGMLARLKDKFPLACTVLMECESHLNAKNNSSDTLISTLTIAHIKNLPAVITEWCRVLKPEADIIITDFHPEALAFGARRTFRHNSKTIVVDNYVYPLEKIKELLFSKGFMVKSEEIRIVDQSVQHYYSEKNALSLYERFYGIPVIYGIHLSRP